MTKRPIIYIAHPISGPTFSVERRNSLRARRKAVEITSWGAAVVLPGWDIDVRDHKTLSWKQWLDADLNLILRVDALFRMPDPKVRVSKGSEMEVAHARANGIPVLFTDADARQFIRSWRKLSPEVAYVASREWVA